MPEIRPKPERIGPEGAFARLRSNLDSLPPAHRRVVQSILEAPDATVRRSVSESATAAGVSTATVVRCAQDLGFRGFQDLKFALARELAAIEAADVKSLARPGAFAEVIRAAIQTLRDAETLVDPASFELAVDSVAEANRVLFVAVGTSFALAQDAGYRFNTIGVRAEAPADVHAQHLTARGLGGRDVCIAISHTGATRETLTAMEAANAAGARTVAVTSYLRSPLTELAGVTLVAGARELSFRLEAVASRQAHMAVLDGLLLEVIRRDEAKAGRALDRFTDVLSEHRL